MIGHFMFLRSLLFFVISQRDHKLSMNHYLLVAGIIISIGCHSLCKYLNVENSQRREKKSAYKKKSGTYL